jgi:hypothetical protein
MLIEQTRFLWPVVRLEDGHRPRIAQKIIVKEVSTGTREIALRHVSIPTRSRAGLSNVTVARVIVVVSPAAATVQDSTRS